jgi:hypothetical protein
MKINVPINDAIQILKERLSDLKSYNFNAEVWKGRTDLDLKQIFGITGDQWLQMYKVDFHTYISADKARVLQQGIQTAEGLLISYIKYIEDYSKIESQKPQPARFDYEENYKTLLSEWNSLVPVHNSLQEKYSNQVSENKRLKDNTIQLDNVSLKKLLTALKNLPAGQVVGIIAVVFTLLAGSFAIGRLVERTSANNDLFDIRAENKTLKEDNIKLQTQIDSKKATIKLLPADKR